MGGIAIVANLDGLPQPADFAPFRPGCWPTSSLEDPVAGPIPPSRRSIRTSTFPISHHRRSPAGRLRHDLCLHAVPSAASEEWKTKYGADTLIAWPLGTGAKARRISSAPCSGDEGRDRLCRIWPSRARGSSLRGRPEQIRQLCRPGPGRRAGRGERIDWANTTDFFASLTDRDGDAAYPISTAVFAVVQVTGRSDDRYRRVHDLFRLRFRKARRTQAALGYVPLPQSLVDQIKQYWARQPPVGN